VLADAAVTLPLTIATGVNDTFNYTPNGGAAELFTMAPHVALATLAAVIAVVAAATGSVSGEAFSTKATPSNGGGGMILLTAVALGVTALGDEITEGNAGAAALGFTGNPDLFNFGTGQLGTVTFNGDGSITLGAKSAIASLADNWGAAWAAQATVNVQANTYGGFQVSYDDIAVTPITTSSYNGLGFLVLAAGAPGNMWIAALGQNGPLSPALSVGLHTVKVVQSGLVAAAYIDGAYQATMPYFNALAQVLQSSRFYLGNYGTAPVTLSALKAWRIPFAAPS